jgi:hypothetical protein
MSLDTAFYLQNIISSSIIYFCLSISYWVTPNPQNGSRSNVLKPWLLSKYPSKSDMLCD